MGCFMARLVGLSGDDLKSIMEPADYARFARTRYLTGDDIRYLDYKYPELLGVWATIATGAGKILKRIGKGVFGRIAKRIREKRQKSSQAQPQTIQQVQPVQQVPQAAQRQLRLVPDSRQASTSGIGIDNTYIYLAVAGVALLLLLRSK